MEFKSTSDGLKSGYEGKAELQALPHHGHLIPGNTEANALGRNIENRHGAGCVEVRIKGGKIAIQLHFLTLAATKVKVYAQDIPAMAAGVQRMRRLAAELGSIQLTVKTADRTDKAGPAVFPYIYFDRNFLLFSHK